MSSSANANLVVTTQCGNCRAQIELILLVSKETNIEHTFWRHVVTGMYGCYLDGRAQMAEDNLATPDWADVFYPHGGLWRYFGYQSTDCAGGCCYNALKDECVNADCVCHTWQ